MFDKYQKRGDYHHNWYNDPNWAWYKECVGKIVDFCKGKTIDVGVGDGVIAQKIMENGHDVLGLDNEQSGLDLAEKHGVRTKLWDLNADAVLDEQFEYLCSLNTIEHLDNPDGLVNLIRNNVTKAAIIVTDEARDTLGSHHQHEYTLDELEETFKEFRTVPFKIESTEFGKPITFIGVEVYKKRRGRPPKVKN